MAKAKGGRGKKECPKCGEVCGARTPVCKKCGHKFVAKKKAKAGMSESDVKKLIATVKEMGGMKEVSKAIDGAEKAIAALDQLGGLDKARETITLLEELRGL